MIRIALIIVFSAGSGVGFYVAKGFFDTIPKSLDEAAIIDGASRWQVFTKITIPLSKPIIVYTILTSFIGPWIDFCICKGYLWCKCRPVYCIYRFMEDVRERVYQQLVYMFCSWCCSSINPKLQSSSCLHRNSM